MNHEILDARYTHVELVRKYDRIASVYDVFGMLMTSKARQRALEMASIRNGENILEVVGGPHVAAIATVDGKLPAVRFMVLNGFPDMTFVGGTMKVSKKVAQLKKNPNVAISTWSGKEFSDPYVEMRAKGEVHEDLATKKKYWVT
jgi:general stress protein 26